MIEVIREEEIKPPIKQIVVMTLAGSRMIITKNINKDICISAPDRCFLIEESDAKAMSEALIELINI